MANRSRLAIAVLLGVVATTSGAAPAGTPSFRGTVTTIPAQLRSQMTSWRPGCPVGVRELRLLTLTYWGFDGRVHEGRLVVARQAAAPMLRAMRRIFTARFPIRRMRLVDAYGSDDDRSMAADNTSAFNCRRVYPGGPWSAHAYGLAIDINPLENPFVTSSGVSPPGGAAFLDRSRWRRGMIHADDAVVRAFAAIGWSWGGSWRSIKDYQHFSASGN